MSGLVLRVVEQRLLLGRAAGLPQATALVSIGVEGSLPAGAFTRIRAGAAALRPGQPLFGVGESDWPAAFLLDPPSGGTDPRRILGEWVVALTVALQRWARDPTWRGRVLPADDDLLRVAIPWQRDGVLTDTLRLALQLLALWSAPGAAVPDVNTAIHAGMEQARAGGLTQDSLRFALAGAERGIPIDIRPGHVQYGWGARMVRLHSTVTNRTGDLAVMIAQDKMLTKHTLGGAGLPVPRGEVVTDIAGAVRAAAEFGWPVVVKPLDQEQGIGVTAGIWSEDALRRAYATAARFRTGKVIVEQHVEGEDYRIRVVNGRYLGALQRIPAGVVGDGVATVAALVDELNTDPRRGEDSQSFMKKLVIDGDVLERLAGQGLGPDSVPAVGRKVMLRGIANLSAGGSAEDVSDRVHPDNRRLAQRAARIVGLDIAGVDFLTPDITESWRTTGGFIIEVNAHPQLGIPDRDIHGEYLDVLFGDDAGRIPVAAISGSKGAALAADLVGRIQSAAGRVTGVCTAGVLRIGADIVRTEDPSGLLGATVLLNDPAVESAVIELDDEHLAEFGHPCDRYDVVALMDSPTDPGETLRRAVRAVVLDAEGQPPGPPVPEVRRILVSADPAASHAHRAAGGDAVFLETSDGARWLTLASGESRIRLAAVDGPDLEARAAMFAAAVAWAQGVDPATIVAVLGDR